MYSKKDAKELVSRVRRLLDTLPGTLKGTREWERYLSLITEEEKQRRKDFGRDKKYLLTVSEMVDLIALRRIIVYFYELSEAPSPASFFHYDLSEFAAYAICYTKSYILEKYFHRGWIPLATGWEYIDMMD